MLTCLAHLIFIHETDMTKIAVLTTSRAEFGLMHGVISQIDKSTQLTLQLIVSGSHLSKAHGYTITEIMDHGLTVAAQIPIFSDVDSEQSNAIANATTEFAKALKDLEPDLVVMMGDRFELLGFASAAVLFNVPIAHLSGGEVTSGAIDDSIRHALTKLSYLHFVSNKMHAERVIRMGENPQRVFNVGEPGLVRLYQKPKFTLRELNLSLNTVLQDNQYFLFTYHPVTTESRAENSKAIGNILSALDEFPEYKIVVTYPNADLGYEVILKKLKKYAADNTDRVILIPSLGFHRYHTALKHCALVLGNSSSALIEAPSLYKPSINIGSRQEGRLSAKSVLHCTDSRVAETIRKGLNEEFKLFCQSVHNPYGNADSIEEIIEQLILFKPTKTVKKVFHDQA